MKGFPEQKWLAIGFSIAVVWLGISSWISHTNSLKLVRENQQAQVSYTILRNLSDLLVAMTTAESRRRGYVFLKDVDELGQYYESIDDIEIELKQLKAQIVENSQQRERLRQVELLLHQQVALLQASIRLHHKTPTNQDQQIIINTRSIRLREQTHFLLAEIEETEEQHLQQWLRESQQSTRDRLWIEIWLITSMLMTLLFGAIVIDRQFRKRQRLEAIQEKLQQQKELNELKLGFFSMVSHEFRTPLSVILGSSQLLAENHQQWSLEKREKSLDRIQSAAKVMTQLLNDILMFTRAEAGKLQYQPETLELASFCLNLVEDVMLANHQTHTIQFSSHSDQAYAYLDEKLIYSILSNLLSNAMKYSPQGSLIQLILEGNSHLVSFQVQDQGIGIPAEDLEHLYDPFYRGRNVNAIAGTGLGLAVVKKCVELHHGTLQVSSQEGQGTTFTLQIPIYARSQLMRRASEPDDGQSH
ncbi:MAG: ATP-binding protein [Synechococcales bacterium]|nr:ATP-binding protein [Synechococcales bacterium]